jgi:hypothetical protein
MRQVFEHVTPADLATGQLPHPISDLASQYAQAPRFTPRARP